ncbi:hypothetical protein VDGL01_00411 [Verticillium dahliae]
MNPTPYMNQEDEHTECSAAGSPPKPVKPHQSDALKPRVRLAPAVKEPIRPPNDRPSDAGRDERAPTDARRVDTPLVLEHPHGAVDVARQVGAADDAGDEDANEDAVAEDHGAPGPLHAGAPPPRIIADEDEDGGVDDLCDEARGEHGDGGGQPAALVVGRQADAADALARGAVDGERGALAPRGRGEDGLAGLEHGRTPDGGEVVSLAAACGVGEPHELEDDERDEEQEGEECDEGLRGEVAVLRDGLWFKNVDGD